MAAQQVTRTLFWLLLLIIIILQAASSACWACDCILATSNKTIAAASIGQTQDANPPRNCDTKI